MAKITYDDRSFMLDGQRIWLVCGAVHYFRLPASQWRDALLKAKRNGLNCIETYVAWNFHEPVEGKWDFTGDRDLAAFIRTAKELGLWVMLRPGPYICAEWDFGGFPAWLTTKPGIVYRTTNATYQHYFDKFFRQVLPRLADLQVTRGGNILLIQNENEYWNDVLPDRLAYGEFINALLRRGGFDIPIINCNFPTDPNIPDTIECANGSDGMVTALKKLRGRQPNAPLVVTEFWDGNFDVWGSPKHVTQPAAETARKAMEMLGCGAQVNYYMFYGGTNFAFWGGRLGVTDDGFMTTSYDYDAPLAEGCGLTPKYYLTRLVNMTAQHMGRFWSTMRMEGPGVNVVDGIDVLNLAGPAGRMAVVTTNGRSDVKTLAITLPDSTALPVSLEAFGATAVPYKLALNGLATLDYANVMPLGLFNPPEGEQKVLAMHGPAGWEARISINGKELKLQVPDGEEPLVHMHESVVLVLMCTTLAQRCWPTEAGLVIGPRYVGETAEDVLPMPGARQYAVVTPEGALTHKKIKTPVAPFKPAAMKLTPWKKTAVCAEPLDHELKWQRMNKPSDVDTLGQYYGYVWYRAEIDSPQARERDLYFDACEDRATLFLNGHYLGTWGRGPGATREPIAAKLKAGRNELVAMVDNLGRSNFWWALGERKGFFGHVYHARPLSVKKPKLAPLAEFPLRLIPRPLQQYVGILKLETKKLYSTQLEFTLPRAVPVRMSWRDLPGYTVAVMCNDRLCGFFPGSWIKGYGDLTLTAEPRKGVNKIKLAIWSTYADVDPAELAKIKLYAFEENLTEKAAWSSRPWAVPASGAKPAKLEAKHLPGWWSATFEYDPAAAQYGPLDVPLFVQLEGATKGQLFLNGHNIGRYWNIGPQKLWYLPAAWLRPHNELLAFDETGAAPTGSKLVLRPGGPWYE